MGTSYATNTFEVIRQALRREMVLALLRVWDTNKKALRLSLIGSELRDAGIVEALAREYGDTYLQGQPPFSRHRPEDTPEDRAAIADAIRAYKKRETTSYIERSVHVPIAKAITIIARYQEGGLGYETLEGLRRIRHTRLAHREMMSVVAPPSPIQDMDVKIDAFFADMLELTRLLRLGVQGVDYDPSATASIQAGYARLFWRSVMGERTEGHPDYQAARVRRPHEEAPSQPQEQSLGGE